MFHFAAKTLANVPQVEWVCCLYGVLYTLFAVEPRIGWSMVMMRCFMTDISNAINYYSLHLINNYCICSFLLALLPVTRHNFGCSAQTYQRITLALLFIACSFCLKTSIISPFFSCGNFFLPLQKIVYGNCWMFALVEWFDADKCIQEIILKTFINGL